jgi:hypothetical protein
MVDHLTTSTNLKAFFWIASGDSYVQEAAKSASTVRDLHPNSDRFLITPDIARRIPSVFNFYVTAPERRGPFWYLDSTRYFCFALKALEAYRQLIYLDTDTRVIRPLDDIFAILAKFDLAGCHAPGRQTRPTMDPVPPTFPEINIGTLGLRNSTKLRRFALDWLTRYEENATFYGNNDQAPLRETLWAWNETPDITCPKCEEEIAGVWDTYVKDRLHYYIMPTEYNFRFGFGGWARYPIHVLHGRTQDWPTLIKAVNEDAKGFRGWAPGELGQ